MDSVPSAALKLLDFIARFESSETRLGYLTIYGNHQTSLPKPITEMTLDELISKQAGWGRTYGSSAAGRYQFMPRTLDSLKQGLKLTGREVFSPEMQDWLGYALLRRRGFDAFVARILSTDRFGLGLAQEWASLPVLRATQGAKIFVNRGQSYYSGILSNKAGVAPEALEAVLGDVLLTPSAQSVSRSREVAMTPASGAPSNIGSTSFDPKPWYMSKGVIGGLIAIATPILSVFFPAARLVDQQTATDWAMKVVAIAGPVLGGLVAVFGRVQATQPISGTKAVQAFATAGLGATAASPVATMMDMPLSAIAADLPQVLLMLQNAGHFVDFLTAPAGRAGDIGADRHDAALGDPDSMQAHLATLADLAAKISTMAPAVAAALTDKVPPTVEQNGALANG